MWSASRRFQPGEGISRRPSPWLRKAMDRFQLQYEYCNIFPIKYQILSTKYKIKVCYSIKLSWGIRYYWQDYSALIFQNRNQMYYLGLSPTWGHGNQSIYSTTKLFLTELRSLLWWLTNRHFYFNFHCSVFITISQRRVFGDDWLEKDFCCIREWKHLRPTVSTQHYYLSMQM